jgi:hypothetical protein
MSRVPPPAALAALAALVLSLSGCGRDAAPQVRTTASGAPAIGARADEPQAAIEYPAFATKNTTRVGGADPVADAVAIARATYPAGKDGPAAGRAKAVALADAGDWHGALAASVLMSAPIGAPVLLSQAGELPAATTAGLEQLAPSGSQQAGDAQVIRIGAVPEPPGLRTTDLRGTSPAAIARAIDAFSAAARGQAAESVIVVSSEDPEYAMPAAGYAAKSGTPILFVTRTAIPPDTRAALRSHQNPRIYVLGPSKVVSPKVTRDLRELGTVTRVGGQDPVSSAVEFAAFTDGRFGWGVADAGHGLVFARTNRPLDAAAAAPLSAAGKFGPLLLLDDADRLPRALQDYLLDIQPGYTKDPVRAFYNHGWLVGDPQAISEPLQARIDEILEIRPVDDRSTPSS